MSKRIRILGERPTILNQYLAEIRDQHIQSDPLRFRMNLERIGELMGFEISRDLLYHETEVQTPLGTAHVPVLADQVVIASILRAGLPMHNGLLRVFDRAGNAFISAFRQYEKNGTFDIQFGYLSSPGLDDKVLILADTMIATGASIEVAINALMEKGRPRHIHIVTAIASRDGLDFMASHLDMERTTLWVGAVDDELTVKAYIVPGLGDAGDLAYGSKE